MNRSFRIMENQESRLKNASFIRCEKEHSVLLCQKCETCIVARQIISTKEWFQRIGEMSQRRFLVSILGQLDSLYLLRYFQNILQATWGKDAIYDRSRIMLRKKGVKIKKSSLNQMPDKTVEEKMGEILCWFSSSTLQTKANYTLLLLKMCKHKLLFTAADVVRALLQRKQTISGLHKDSKDMLFSPEKDDNTHFDFSHVYLTAINKNRSFRLSKDSGKERLHVNSGRKASNNERQRESSFPCTSEMNRQFSIKPDTLKGECATSDLLLDLDTVQNLSSGVSKYRDFIRLLPVHLSKYILSMLDKSTLNKCVSVSQHWATLAQQVKVDLLMRTFIQNRVALLKGAYTRGINPSYANKLFVPVPKTTESGRQIRVKNQKWKLRTKSDYTLWTAYQNQETQQVHMEERNVFCGTYNVRILSYRKDKHRVIHYSGGDLVAVSSNRKIYLLDIVHLKEIPIQFRGHAGSVRALFLCEKENFLLSGSYDLSIRCWDLKSGACIRLFSGHQGTITCMDLCKNRLVSGARDCQVKEWDLETGKCLKTFKHKDPISATRINDTYIISSCEQGLIKVWNIATALLVKTLSGHEGAVKCLCFDKWHLLSGSTDGLVMAWSMVGKYERCLMGYRHPKEVLHVALTFLRVISACADGKIRIYNFLNGNCLKVIKANARGDPVLSFFFQGNRMLINTESNILMFQFENIKWQYSVDRAKKRKARDKAHKAENSLTEVLSKASTPAYSVGTSISSKQTVAQESLSSKPRRSRVISRASKMLMAPSVNTLQSQGKLKSPQRDGDGKTVSSIFKKENGLDGGQENLEAKFFTDDDVEKLQDQGELQISGNLTSCSDLTSHSKKRSCKISMLPDIFLLTINALQQAHHSEEFAYPHRSQTQITDDWTPSISYPRKVLSFKKKSIQQAVENLRGSNPTIDMKQTTIPLEIQKLQPNLKVSLHSPHVQSTIPQPMIIHPRVSDSLKGGDQATSPRDRTIHSFKPLTSSSVEPVTSCGFKPLTSLSFKPLPRIQVVKPNRVQSPSPVVKIIQPVKRKRICLYTILDPFKMKKKFTLLTASKEKEYMEARVKEFQATKATGVVNSERASKAAWIRKSKGLPIDKFMKQGKIAAPELGRNEFI